MEFSNFAADSHQTPNVPGIRRFWKIRRKAFTGSWPLLADTTTGEITSDPLAKLPAYFVTAEYVVPQNTKDANFTNLPELGYDTYSHSFDYEMAGMTKDLMAEVMKSRNADVVFVVEDTDEQLWVLGTSDRGLVETIKGGFGKLGNDKRGLVINATNDGFMWPPLPLNDANKSAWLVRAVGYGPFFQRNVVLNNDFTVGFTINLQPGDENGALLPQVFDYYFGQRAGIAWNFGDTVLICNGLDASLASPPRLSMSLKDGWCKAQITGFGLNGLVSFMVLETGVGGFTSNFVAFHKDRPKFTNLTSSFYPPNGYYGYWTLTYTGGTLPYVAGDNVYVQWSSGAGQVRKISGVFVSQVGTTVEITVADTVLQSTAPAPAATVGFEIMENVIYV